MKKILQIAYLTFVLALLSHAALTQQISASGGIAARMVVTVEAHHGTNIPVINRQDVMVYEGHDRDQVTDWVPLVGDHAGLELFVLIDDGSNSSLDSQLGDLKQFYQRPAGDYEHWPWIHARWHRPNRPESNR